MLLLLLVVALLVLAVIEPRSALLMVFDAGDFMVFLLAPRLDLEACRRVVCWYISLTVPCGLLRKLASIIVAVVAMLEGADQHDTRRLSATSGQG